MIDYIREHAWLRIPLLFSAWLWLMVSIIRVVTDAIRIAQHL